MVATVRFHHDGGQVDVAIHRGMRQEELAITLSASLCIQIPANGVPAAVEFLGEPSAQRKLVPLRSLCRLPYLLPDDCEARLVLLAPEEDGSLNLDNVSSLLSHSVEGWAVTQNGELELGIRGIINELALGSRLDLAHARLLTKMAHIGHPVLLQCCRLADLMGATKLHLSHLMTMVAESSNEGLLDVVADLLDVCEALYAHECLSLSECLACMDRVLRLDSAIIAEYARVMPLKEAGDASLAKMLTQFSPKEREQESDRGVPFSTGANAPTPPSLSQASTPAAKMSDNQVENGEQSESDMEESESNRRLRCNIIKQALASAAEGYDEAESKASRLSQAIGAIIESDSTVVRQIFAHYCASGDAFELENRLYELVEANGSVHRKGKFSSGNFEQEAWDESETVEGATTVNDDDEDEGEGEEEDEEYEGEDEEDEEDEVEGDEEDEVEEDEDEEQIDEQGSEEEDDEEADEEDAMLPKEERVSGGREDGDDDSGSEEFDVQFTSMISHSAEFLVSQHRVTRDGSIALNEMARRQSPLLLAAVAAFGENGNLDDFLDTLQIAAAAEGAITEGLQNGSFPSLQQVSEEARQQMGPGSAPSDATLVREVLVLLDSMEEHKLLPENQIAYLRSMVNKRVSPELRRAFLKYWQSKDLVHLYSALAVLLEDSQSPAHMSPVPEGSEDDE